MLKIFVQFNLKLFNQFLFLIFLFSLYFLNRKFFLWQWSLFESFHQLILQSINLLTNSFYNIFILINLIRQNFLLILNRFSFDIFSSIGIFKSIQSFFKLTRCWGNSHDHDCFAFTPQRIFKKSGQLRISKIYINSFFIVSQCIDAVRECQ